MGKLDNKVAIVTGGAKGLGKTDARMFAEEGAQVIITDVDEKMGQETAEELGDAVTFLRHDVSNEQDWIDVIKQTQELLVGLHILVNNAGIVQVADPESTTFELWKRINAVCSDGIFLGCKHAIPAIRDSGGGSIINMSSITALSGSPLVAAYSAAKGAVRAYSRTVAIHCKEKNYNIRCNAIFPGGIDTPMLASVFGAPPKSSVDTPPNARPAHPEELASLILYLASDDASYITGGEFVVDNGATAGSMATDRKPD